MSFRIITLVLTMAVLSCVAVAQQQQTSSDSQQSAAPAKHPPMTASAKLAAAKTAYVRNAGGGDTAYTVIESGLEGWGKFTLVDSPSKADIIVEVSSPEEGGVSVTSSSQTPGADGRPETSTSTSRDLSSGP